MSLQISAQNPNSLTSINKQKEFYVIKNISCLSSFYCDSIASWQKPHVKTNHRLFRYICPNKVNLYDLGLTSQEALDLVFSHINSYRREEYHFKSFIELIEFYCPNSNILNLLNIKKIDPDSIVLTPDLIKKK